MASQTITGNAHAAQPARAPAVAIQAAAGLVPCCGQLEYTKLCVPSLLRHSRGA
jgi:hypothetical protein